MGNKRHERRRLSVKIPRKKFSINQSKNLIEKLIDGSHQRRH